MLYDNDNPSALKPDTLNNKDNFDILLKSGSLLIMSGSSQKYFSHSIPTEHNYKNNVRYSLTFREYLN